ncbi:MAG: ATP F0F1 synthase subunit B [Paracoccaceae bacterium]
MSLLLNTDAIVALGLLVFFALVAYAGAHRLILKGLDDRANAIRSQLDEARALREEAQATFAEFERKQREVQSQAEDIVAHARREAEQAAEKAKADLAASIERRMKAADDQLAMAEANAVKEIRDRAIKVSIAAAEEVIRARMTDDQAAELADQGIAGLATRLH